MLSVIKLGGSLYHNPQLTDCIQAITEFSKTHQVLMVPGGGPFADSVRQAQLEHGLSDKAAHQMAINAMRQFGLLLIDLLPDATIFSGIKKPSTLSNLSIWLPNDSELMTADLPQNWQVTADTLSLWLAQKLNAAELILIKSCEISTGEITTLSENAVLDDHFAKQFQYQPLPCSIVQRVDANDWLLGRISLQ